MKEETKELTRTIIKAQILEDVTVPEAFDMARTELDYADKRPIDRYAYKLVKSRYGLEFKKNLMSRIEFLWDSLTKDL